MPNPLLPEVPIDDQRERVKRGWEELDGLRQHVPQRAPEAARAGRAGAGGAARNYT